MANLFCKGQITMTPKGKENWDKMHWNNYKDTSEEPKSINTPNPGSEEAIRQGCTCPILDNCYGNGFLYGGEKCFYIQEDCPLHDRGKK